VLDACDFTALYTAARLVLGGGARSSPAAPLPLVEHARLVHESAAATDIRRRPRDRLTRYSGPA
jgi:hypothetical protein